MSLDVLLNGLVSLIAISQVTAKATDGKVARSTAGLKLVNVGELSGGYQRHSQPVDGGPVSFNKRFEKQMRDTEWPR